MIQFDQINSHPKYNLITKTTFKIICLFVKILMKDEYVHCTMSENTATLLDEPLVLVPFILKLCTVWQYFSASAFSFVSSKPGT